jgi:predicted transcriptional regulator
VRRGTAYHLDKEQTTEISTVLCAKGITKSRFALHLGLTPPVFSQILHGKKHCDIRVRKAIRELLDVNIYEREGKV